VSQSLISVIVPLYNYEKYIVDCIRSILAQTYTAFELIIVDDCSTDSSFKLARQFKSDKHVQILQTPKNMGYSSAKNYGIRASSGDIITLLDADDMFPPWSLEVREEALRVHNVDLVHARAKTIGPTTTLADMRNTSRTACSKKEHANVHAQTVMYLRRLHVDYGLYDDTLIERGDKEMWFRLFGEDLTWTKYATRFFMNNTMVAYRRRHKVSMQRRVGKSKQYIKQVNDAFRYAIKQRREHGITVDNTSFLDA